MIEVKNMAYAIKQMSGDICDETTIATTRLRKAGLSSMEIANLKKNIYCANQKANLLNEITDMLIKVANEQLAFGTLLNDMAKEVNLRYGESINKLRTNITAQDARRIHGDMVADAAKMEILEKIISEYHKGEL